MSRRHRGYNHALQVALQSITQSVNAFVMYDATGLPYRGFQAVKWAGDPTFSGKGPFSGVLLQQHEGSDVHIHDLPGFVDYMRHVLARGHSRDTNRRQLECAIRAWREAALVAGVGRARWKDGLDGTTVASVHAALKALPTDTLLAARAIFDLEGAKVALEFLRTTPGYE